MLYGIDVRRPTGTVRPLCAVPLTMRTTTSRRALLALGAGSALAAVGCASAQAEPTTSPVPELRALERKHGARLGVYAHNTATGRTVRYRAGELFPLCSTHKVLSVAALLHQLDGPALNRTVHYTKADCDDSGYAPVTGKAANLAHGMTVAELCAAALAQSDNCASNLLVKAVGGPRAVTRFVRSTGDRTTRLDRWEPELNSAEPGRLTDTTSPAALGRTYARLVLGHALHDPADRHRLTTWMRADATNTARFRAGLPHSWDLADKTGTGDYGTANNAGIAWTPHGTPLVLSVLTTKPRAGKDAKPDDALVAAAAKVLASALV